MYKRSILFISLCIISIACCAQIDSKLEKKAQNGNAKAQFELAYLYYVKNDFFNAEYWFREASKQQYEKSYYWLAELLEGRGEYKEAAIWLEKQSVSRRKGNQSAEIKLADYYREGKLGSIDYFKAKYWYEKSIKKENGIWINSSCQRSIYYLAICCDSSSNYSDALKWYTEAYNGHYDGFGSLSSYRINALVGLIRLYLLGLGVNKNTNEVNNLISFLIKELKKSCVDIGQILNSFAFRYMNTSNTENDGEMARFWFDGSVHYKNAEAAFLLGTFSEKGLFKTKKDLQEAVKFYRTAATFGSLKAKCRLGIMYETGEGVARDYQKAYENYVEVLEEGNENNEIETIMIAKAHLGVMFYNANYVRRDGLRAFKYLSEVAQMKNATQFLADYPVAFRTLSACYRYGEVTPVNIELQSYWDKVARELGDDVSIMLEIQRMKANNLKELESIPGIIIK